MVIVARLPAAVSANGGKSPPQPYALCAAPGRADVALSTRPSPAAAHDQGMDGGDGPRRAVMPAAVGEPLQLPFPEAGERKQAHVPMCVMGFPVLYFGWCSLSLGLA